MTLGILTKPISSIFLKKKPQNGKINYYKNLILERF